MFDGATYDPTKDRGRLYAQLVRVRDLMSDGKWRTLAEISDVVGSPEASVSARLRDLRKAKFGSREVVAERIPNGNGLHRYRLVPLRPPVLE